MSNQKIQTVSAQSLTGIAQRFTLPWSLYVKLLAVQNRIVTFLDNLQVETRKELDALIPGNLDKTFKEEL
ncbi:MAG: hypothetical protein A2Y97_00915 [Nitrospirae bacterium RBG_13_39_12]|nr:MAG: hypothetical protein A2Y97_00915 [Nitrospirae bacterium RBG_13_39_12]